MTRKDYDIPRLIRMMKDFRQRYPWLKVILEPGSAFAWQTGCLKAAVVDVVEDYGIKTAILNVSFTCHMPDCLEMPYQPAVRGAKSLPLEAADKTTADESEGQGGGYVYRLGGNSCLAGDFMGAWRFEQPLEVGDEVIFEDMLHYTTVKTCMFNGISHPSIALLHSDGTLQMLREYTYEDYRDRMD